MSQIILYQASAGIFLATDSRAVQFTSAEEPIYFEVNKLFPLGRGTLLATVGAGFGLALCRDFEKRMRQMRVFETEDIFEQAMTFFPAAMERLQEQSASSPRDRELQRVYLVLAGYRREAGKSRFPFVVLASEHAADPLHPLTTGHFVCIPRQIKIEYRLSQLAPDQVDLDQLQELCTSCLAQLARNSEDLAPPFHFARITASGVEIRTVTELPL
jgi:hypothetical protein